MIIYHYKIAYRRIRVYSESMVSAKRIGLLAIIGIIIFTFGSQSIISNPATVKIRQIHQPFLNTYAHLITYISPSTGLVGLVMTFTLASIGTTSTDW